MSTQAHVDLLSLLTFSAAYSGLSHDYDRDVRQLMDLLVNHAPRSPPPLVWAGPQGPTPSVWAT